MGMEDICTSWDRPFTVLPKQVMQDFPHPQKGGPNIDLYVNPQLQHPYAGTPKTELPIFGNPKPYNSPIYLDISPKNPAHKPMYPPPR